jgi:hypothetical protein
VLTFLGQRVPELPEDDEPTGHLDGRVEPEADEGVESATRPAAMAMMASAML